MNISEKLTQIAENQQKVYDAGIEEGKQAEWNTFWDGCLQNGNRENFTRAFCGLGWNKKTFRPPIDIKPIGGGAANWMFRDFNTGPVDRMSLTKESIGVEIDLSGATGENGYVFYNAFISELDTVDVSNMANFPYGLALCKAYTVRRFIVSEMVSLGFAFEKMTSLENITFEGTIGKNIDLHWSQNLTKASYDSILMHTSFDVTITLTFSLVGVNKTYETSEGANDGSTSDEWVNMWKPMGNVTIALI